MHSVSRRQRELIQRDATILQAAQEILSEDGYYGLTMERVARKSSLPKGTIYLRFGCKEDVVLALAERAVRKRVEMMQRGAAFLGRSRERILAIGEAVGLFLTLYPAESRVIHTAMGPLREKASPERVAALVQVETEAMEILRGVLRGAIEAQDLVLQGDTTLEEILLGTWGLVDGAQVLIESGAPQRSLGIQEPLRSVWRYFNVVADGYGWRPLFSEWDYEQSLSRVRREIFPEEVRQACANSAWYGSGR